MVDQKAWNRSKDSSKDKLILLQFQSLKEHGRSFFFLTTKQDKPNYKRAKRRGGETDPQSNGNQRIWGIRAKLVQTQS